MDIRLLGPIEASLDGRQVVLGAPQQRAVLAMLALEVNQTVSADRLSEGLWGERAPATAPKMVQLYVSQLRKLLRGSEAQILTRGRGYELRLAIDRVDAARFEQLVAAAEHADGAPNGEARAALALWRGSPLADVAHEPFASAEIRRLEDLRLQAAELAIHSDLVARRHGEVLGELRSLIAEEPLRERLRAQQMLALYRSGRQADALAAYRDARTALVEAIGVEPGPELRHLHEAILRQDPRLAPAEASDAIELPPELDTATPLVGREADLEWLRGHWQRALAGAGGLVLVAGERGIGKTRLVAELAAEVIQDRAVVRYVAARDSAAEASREALAAARTAPGPTLLVLDDVGDDVETDLSGGRSPAWRNWRCSWWPLRNIRRARRFARARRDADHEAAERRRRARSRPALCGRVRGRRRAGRAPAGGQRRLAIRPARHGVGVGAHAGAAPSRRVGRPHHGRAVGAARGRGRPGREHRQAAGRSGANGVARACPR